MSRKRHLSDWQLYRALWQHLTVHWSWLILIIISMILTALIDPLFAGFLKVIIDQHIRTGEHTRTWLYPLILLGLFLARALFSYISTSGNAHVVYRLIDHLRNQLFAHIQKLPFDTLRRYGSATLLSRITYDALQVSELGLNALSIIIRDTLTIIGLCLLLLWYSPLLSFFVVCVIPLIWASVAICKRIQRDVGLRIQDSMGTFSALLTEGIELQESIRVFHGEAIEQERVAAESLSLRRMHIRQIAIGALNSSAVQLLVGLALCLVLYFGALFSQRGQFTIGTFVSFITAMILLFQPFRRITTIGYVIQRGLAAAESIFDILHCPTEASAPTIDTPLSEAPVTLRFEDIHFHYPDTTKTVLTNISFSIAAGERVALVGMSGCGKSTLLRLLLGFYQPSHGRIFINDIDISSCDPYSLRKYFALVSQETQLFNKSIHDNIVYGRYTRRAQTEIHTALEQAQATSFINALPEGMASVIGHDGNTLSGGQRQRLQIARAFLKSAPIYLFDEATSALDPETESRIQWPQTTTLFVTHRLHLAAQCDRILVFDQGRLVGSGTHEYLLKHNTQYLYLYQMSARGEKA